MAHRKNGETGDGVSGYRMPEAGIRMGFDHPSSLCYAGKMLNNSFKIELKKIRGWRVFGYNDRHSCEGRARSEALALSRSVKSE